MNFLNSHRMVTCHLNRLVLCIIAVMCCVLVCSCQQNKPNHEAGVLKPTDQQPNIVFILADDLGISDLPVYGNIFNEAPNISKLANQGRVFTNAYAAPVCSPSRASIQTGQVPARVGITDWIPGHWRPYEEALAALNQVQELPEDVTTIGEMLSESGYRTGYFGKWHLGTKSPNEHGYDEAYSSNGGPYYQSNLVPEYKEYEGERMNDALTKLGIRFMEKNKNNPFFLLISHYDVHVQLDADSSLINKYLNKPKADGYPSNAVYAAMVEHLDKSVGDIVDYIDGAGLSDNTIIIFYSDNGGLEDRFDGISLLAENSLDAYPTDHPLRYVASSNLPYRGGKGTLYEGGIRVPLIVRWPGQTAVDSMSQAIVSCEDFMPTFAEMTGSPLPKDQVVDGVSMVPALIDNVYNPDRELFVHYPVYHHDIPKSSLRKGDWKIIENLVNGEYELYNLKFDCGEGINLVGSFPDKLEEMSRILEKWKRETKAQIPILNSEFDAVNRYEWGTHPDRK